MHFFEKLLTAFAAALSPKEQLAAIALPLFKWLLKNPQLYRFVFAQDLVSSPHWLGRYSAGILLGQLYQDGNRDLALAALKELSQGEGISVDGAARGLAALLDKELNGPLGKKIMEEWWETGNPLQRECLVLSLGVFAETWPLHQDLIRHWMEAAASDENGRVSRHVGQGLMGRLFYARDALWANSVITEWMDSKEEGLRMQCLRFFLSPAGKDPEAKSREGLEKLSKDQSKRIRESALLPLEKFHD